jgi:hypothetical protein
MDTHALDVPGPQRPPAEQAIYSRLVSEDDAARVWAISEELTGVALPPVHQTSPSRQSQTS